MNSNTSSLLNASGISLRNGGLLFIGAGALHHNAFSFRLVRHTKGAWLRSDTRRMPRKSILIHRLDAFRIHQPRAPATLL
jgi:hypothetical protein